MSTKFKNAQYVIILQIPPEKQTKQKKGVMEMHVMISKKTIKNCFKCNDNDQNIRIDYKVIRNIVILPQHQLTPFVYHILPVFIVMFHDYLKRIMCR